MAIAVVCAAFDAATNARIAELRALIRSLGGKSPTTPAHRPHLTLSAANVEDPEQIIRLTRRVARRHEPFRLRMLSVGTFGRGDVVFLAPRLSPGLRELQVDAYEALVRAGHEPAFAGQSNPREWRPHCTIARRMTPDLLAEVQAQFRPFNFTIEGIATIRVGGHGDLGYEPLARRP